MHFRHLLATLLNNIKKMQALFRGNLIYFIHFDLIQIFTEKLTLTQTLILTFKNEYQKCANEYT